ncbi:DUF1659 domain-containing protein [Bacillus sp. HMF5848]|nr:DUF1659 domain-containing protein [Bacillus sp. HMF5848]
MKDSQLRIVYVVGSDENGEPIFKNKNYNNVKTEAVADQLFAVAQAIASLQQHTVDHLERNNTRFIENVPE